MNILALDTSGDYCSLALWLDGEVTSREVLAEQKHSQVLLPLLDELFAESGISLSKLDGIAFGAGPGSFTGLRIACGVAQGLAFAADLPVAGICTLEALAEAMPGKQVIASLDARMGEIYHAAYEKRGDHWRQVSKPALCLPQQAPQVAGGGWSAAAMVSPSMRRNCGGVIKGSSLRWQRRPFPMPGKWRALQLRCCNGGKDAKPKPQPRFTCATRWR